jgi:hypothetical protein
MLVKTPEPRGKLDAAIMLETTEVVTGDVAVKRT